MTPALAAAEKNTKDATERNWRGKKAVIIRDALEGYKKSEIIIDGETYPVIVPDSGSVVEGMVIEISPAELKLIDEYETDAYKRVKVVLKSGDSVWVYVKN